MQGGSHFQENIYFCSQSPALNVFILMQINSAEALMNAASHSFCLWFLSDILRRFLMSFLRQAMPALKGRIQLIIKCGVRWKVFCFSAALRKNPHLWAYI